MKISEVINLAIDEYLWDGIGNCSHPLEGGGLSSVCAAVYWNTDHFVGDFLEELGWSDSFDEFPAGPKRQYARAFALTFAALIAEEEGV